MKALRLIFLLAMLFPGATSVAAQESFAESLQAIDSPTDCDGVGWSVMPGEFANGTFDFERQAACHFSVYGTLVASCIEPYVYLGPEYDGGPPPGTAHIFCSVGVLNTDDGGIPMIVDPNDFSITTGPDATYEPDPSLIRTLEPYVLKRTELIADGAIASGILTFSVPDTIERPFVLMWWPGKPTHKDPVGIVMDRMIPWDDAKEILTVI